MEIIIKYFVPIFVPIFTIILSFLVYEFNKYRLYVEFITKERIRWLKELKDNASKFLEISYFLKNSFENKIFQNEYLKKMSELQFYISRIILDLNPKEKKHAFIISDLKSIRKILKNSQKKIHRENPIEELFNQKENKIENLEKKLQEIFKEEWERIKKESRKFKTN